MATQTDHKEAKKSPKEKKAKKKERFAIIGEVGREKASIVLKHPHVTEKSHELAQQGVFVFNVSVSADKTDVKRAVEELYKVHVRKVRMIRQHGESRRFGRSLGKTKDQKKAMVTLAKGESIEIFEGA